jgi:hypothetical protein
MLQKGREHMKPLSKEHVSLWLTPQTKKLIASALAWAKSWTTLYTRGDLAMCDDCKTGYFMLFKSPQYPTALLCKDCLLSRAFGEVVKD